MKQGLFITLEGPDGAGKSSQTALLSSWLENQGHKVLVTREPGGSSIGKKIRQMVLDPSYSITPTAEAILYGADRAQHVAEEVAPALKKGQIVICDRYIDSLIAYQGYGRGVDRIALKNLNNLATGGLKPDLTILLCISAAEGLARLPQRGNKTDRIEQEDINFHDRVAKGFLAIAKENPQRFCVINAAADMKTVAKLIQEAVTPILAAWQNKK